MWEGGEGRGWERLSRLSGPPSVPAVFLFSLPRLAGLLGAPHAPVRTQQSPHPSPCSFPREVTCGSLVLPSRPHTGVCVWVGQPAGGGTPLDCRPTPPPTRARKRLCVFCRSCAAGTHAPTPRADAAASPRGVRDRRGRLGRLPPHPPPPLAWVASRRPPPPTPTPVTLPPPALPHPRPP